MERRIISNYKDKDLIDVVFSWSLEDILNEHLYKTQVGKIPNSFQSVQHYLGSYLIPLLEEVRAELSSSLKVISQAPFSEISIEESKPYGALLYNIEIACWSNRFGNRAKEPYRPLPGDVFAITDAKPETVADFQKTGKTWNLGWIPKLKVDSSGKYYKLKAAKDLGVKDGMRKPLFIVFLVNTIPNNRIWKSLHFVGNANVINKVLCTNSVVEEICDQCSLYSNAVYAEKLGSSFSSALNESQRAAVLCCICKMNCNHKSSVEIMWGPPGTGKTKTVSVLLSAVLGMKRRVLTCAPTNVAITGVAFRVMKLVKESSELFCSLGDLLLFGSKEKLKLDPELEQIYLDYRIERLLECFGPVTGWKKSFASMIEFFESCTSQYHTFMENELSKNEGSGKKKKKRKEESFLLFARNQFQSVALPLKKCVQNLCIHIPRSFILEHNFQNMVLLVSLLGSFESLLSQKNVVSEDLEKLFSCPESVQYSPDPLLFTSKFLHLRSQCLSILRSLQLSLGGLLPSFASKYSVKRFCFKRASLIFCTVSSSFKLYSIKMEPMNLLVIDEAAQMKECESVIPLQLPGITHAILIGDECQLPATVISKVSNEAGYGRSLFERLNSLGHSKHLLNIQYRMHPSISCFPNFKFYTNQILDAPNVTSTSYVKHYLPGSIFGPYSFINVCSGKEERDDVGHSQKNIVEVAVVIKIIQKLYEAWSCSRVKLSIGIISPYAAQVVAIQDKLERKYEKGDLFTVKVKSIDGFQGSEEDIIILSTVRSNNSGSIGFLSNPQRINVALTRARHCLWILGNGMTLARSQSIWEAVVHDAKDRQCYFEADEDRDLASAIIEVKRELFQFDDLLDKDSLFFRRAKWKILFSDNFRKSILKLNSDRRRSVIRYLLRLSTGWRPEKNARNSDGKSSFQILKRFKVEHMYIICTVDIEKELKSIQVLKVWDILPLEDIPILIKSVHDLLGMYTDDFLNHCKAKCIEGDSEVPMRWGANHDIVRYKDLSEIQSEIASSEEAVDDSYLERSNMKDTLLLMKFYSLSHPRVSHLLSGCDGGVLDLPYQVSDQQYEIILFPGNTFLIGRPGVEKNIVLTTKLFQREQQKYMCAEGFSVVPSQRNKVEGNIERLHRNLLCQLFITFTPKQCLAVKKCISYLKRGTQCEHFRAEGSSVDDMDEVDDIAQFIDIPDSFVDLPLTSYPLVITFQKFLMMLDGSMGTSFFERFHKLWGLSDAKPGYSRTVALQTYIRMKEVNYERFSSHYWPHFDSQLKKKLDAFTVFHEISSHIKGGLQGSKFAHCGKLSRDDYVKFSKGQASTVNRKARERIYELFLDYEKRKMENEEYDLADLVIDLHCRLENKCYGCQEMDFVYIDEVQNLTMGQIALFKYVCQNFNEGFVFSGDTAPTIARGIQFRFQDIRFLFYKEFKFDRSDENDKALRPISDILHLSQYLHIQPGVLNLARSVVDILFRFFPHFVDIICPETCDASVIRGDSPIFLEPKKDKNALVTIFGTNINVSDSNAGFGAEQVILVRDRFSQNKIADLVGKQALVLTITECQGLEFKDVLLYNFFSSFPLKNQWRVIYEYMKEQDLLDLSPGCYPSFNLAKHGDLCRELKQLYLAITRARERLWICEDAEELSNPMFDYWKKLCLVQVRQLDDCLVHAMKVGSSEEEWRSQGRKLYCEGNYEMAAICFERAGDKYTENWAKAAGHHIAADRMRAGNPEMAYNMLSEATETFCEIGRAEQAAQCLIELKEYEKAGTIYLETYGSSRLEDAGDCFFLAESYKLAAEVYARGKHFSKLLLVCTNAKFFDMGLQFIQNWNHDVRDIEMVKRSHELEEYERVFLENGALHYHELKDNWAMLKFVRCFHSLDSKRTFLKNMDCFDDLLILETESGNFIEAAAIAKMKGDLLLEVDLLEKGGRFKEASMLLLFNVFANSLWATGNTGWPLKLVNQQEELLAQAKLLAKNETDYFYEFVCTEANILLNHASSLFEMQVHLSSSQRQRNLRGIIVSARRILDAHHCSSPSEYDWEVESVTDSRQHAEDKISRNQVSVETLVYFWNFWKEKIVHLINYLCFPETGDFNECMEYEEFCLHYLGLRKQINDQNVTYRMVISDADWLKNIDKGSLQRNGDLISMDARQFLAAASSYWFSELIYVGIKVLENLRALHVYSMTNPLPVFCQCVTLIHICEVIEFFMESKFCKSFTEDKTLQKVFDMGLQSILVWRNHEVLDLDVPEIYQEARDIAHSFLKKCAVHYHGLQDYITMLKFVGALHSMDSKRSFLKSLDCINELMTLEIESGNFMEAAAIAKLKGDLVKEAELLEKAGNHTDASLLLLSYVLANSLWANGSLGWPLKSCKRKGKLLAKAKSFAENVSDIFHEFVCIEANILSDQPSSIALMEQIFSISQKHENLGGTILIARKILDAYLRLDKSNYRWEDETLVYFWNFWKDSIVNIFEYLCSLERGDVIDDTSYGEVCLRYLGVRKQLNNEETVYVLVNSNAAWSSKHDCGTLGSNGGLSSMDVSQFISDARNYWFSEVNSVGLKVLEYLKAFYKFSVKKSFSSLCQSMTAIHFFEVVKFLTGSKFFKAPIQKFFGMRLEFFKYYKKHVSFGGCVDELEHVFLEKCAFHYHEHQDRRTMMEFVSKFHSMGSKRVFLKNLGCYDELVLLEEESGNFIEASNIAKLKGDIFLEVDLLQKAGRLKEAAMLILSYVLANSLWAPGNNQFLQEDELLTKGKSFAKQYSDEFYESVCAESNILLGGGGTTLFELKQDLGISRQYNNLTCEIVSARKILDAHIHSNISEYEWENELIIDMFRHSEDKISHNRVSVETLFYYWNFWKENIVNVIEYLECLGTQDVTKYLKFEEFCLSYFGVRRHFGNKNMYQLLNPEAEWVRISDLVSLQRDRNMVSMDNQFFSFAARKYWCTELLSVGMEVLETLRALNKFSVENSFTLFCQSITSVRLFEVARFLSGFKFFDTSRNLGRLQEYLDSCTEKFFENVFSLDWTKSMTKSLIDLRRTEISKDILREIVSKMICSENVLTHGKIGRIVIASFGCGKLPDQVHEMIERKFDANPSWKAFFYSLRGQMVANKVHERFEALRDAHDYISPDCFVYILERHLVSVCYIQNCFYTLRSSFADWLVCEERITCPATSLLHSYDLIAGVVNQILVNRQGSTTKWIQRFDVKSKEYYPLLVLRLVVIMCLLCANSGKYFDVLHNLLLRSDVRSQLPKEFYDVFQGRRKLKTDFIYVLGIALVKIKNPLVIVSDRKQCQNSLCPDAIFISPKNACHKEDILDVLFSEKSNEVQHRIGANILQGSSIATTSDGDCEHPREIFEILKSLEVEYDSNARSFASNTQSIRVKLEMSIDVIKDVISQSYQKCSRKTDRGKTIIAEANIMLHGVKKLTAALDISDPMMGKILKKVQWRRLRLEALLNDPVLRDNTDVIGETSKSKVASEIVTKNPKEKGDSKKVKMVWERKAKTEKPNTSDF